MDIISLNEYVFIEQGYISLNELIRFLEINIISCQNIIASNDYTFVNKYMFFEWISISLTVNKYIISLKLNKYNSLKLQKYSVAGCKIMPWVQIYFV